MKSLLEYFNESIGAPLSMRNNDRFPKVKEPGTILDKQQKKYESIMNDVFSKMLKKNLYNVFSPFHTYIHFNPDTSTQFNISMQATYGKVRSSHPDDADRDDFIFTDPDEHEDEFNPTLFKYIAKIMEQGIFTNSSIKNWFKACGVSWGKTWDDDNVPTEFVYIKREDRYVFEDKLNKIAKKNNWNVEFEVVNGGIRMLANYNWNHDFKKFAEETAEHFYKCIETYFGDIAKRL